MPAGLRRRPQPSRPGKPAADDRRKHAAKEPAPQYPRPPKPAKQYTIGVLIPQLSNPHFIGQAYGYIDEAEKLGAKVILHDAGGYQYIEKQVSQMEDLIASKVDAIDLVAINGSATVPMVDARGRRRHSGHQLQRHDRQPQGGDADSLR